MLALSTSSFSADRSLSMCYILNKNYQNTSSAKNWNKYNFNPQDMKVSYENNFSTAYFLAQVWCTHTGEI